MEFKQIFIFIFNYKNIYVATYFSLIVPLWSYFNTFVKFKTKHAFLVFDLYLKLDNVIESKLYFTKGLIFLYKINSTTLTS